MTSHLTRAGLPFTLTLTLAASLPAGCCPPSDPGGEGAEMMSGVDATPKKFEPAPGQLEAMDDACQWYLGIDSTAASAGPLLRPSDECLAAIDDTLTWSVTFEDAGDAGARARASILDVLWVLFYVPVVQPGAGVVLDMDLPYPSSIADYIPAPADAGVDELGPAVTWVNTAARARFYSSTWLLAYDPSDKLDGVLARWKNNVVTVRKPFSQQSLDEDGRPKWLLGARYELSAILLHEALHGIDTPWNHELCPTEAPGTDPGCDDDASHSAYAMEAAWLEGQQIALLRLQAATGFTLVTDKSWNGALEGACRRVSHVIDPEWPEYLRIRQCQGIGTNYRDEYEDIYLQ